MRLTLIIIESEDKPIYNKVIEYIETYLIESNI